MHAGTASSNPFQQGEFVPQKFVKTVRLTEQAIMQDAHDRVSAALGLPDDTSPPLKLEPSREPDGPLTPVAVAIISEVDAPTPGLLAVVALDTNDTKWWRYIDALKSSEWQAWRVLEGPYTPHTAFGVQLMHWIPCKKLWGKTGALINVSRVPELPSTATYRDGTPRNWQWHSDACVLVTLPVYRMIEELARKAGSSSAND